MWTTYKRSECDPRSLHLSVTLTNDDLKRIYSISIHRRSGSGFGDKHMRGIARSLCLTPSGDSNRSGTAAECDSAFGPWMKLTVSNGRWGLDPQEIALLAECRSQYITEYYGSHVQNTKLWIVMEFMAGGSVADMVCTHFRHLFSATCFLPPALCRSLLPTGASEGDYSHAKAGFVVQELS